MLRICIAVAVLLGVAYVIGSGNSNFFAPSGSQAVDGGKTIHSEYFRCQHKETLNRLIDLAVANDKEAFSQFTQRQMLAGECSHTPPIGTKVRVEDSSWGLICIAPFGSAESCQWTLVEAIK
jgi:hypothetical protein